MTEQEGRTDRRQTFPYMSRTFIRNVQSVRAFNERIGPIADEHDRAVTKQMMDAIREIAPEAADQEGELIIRTDSGKAGDTKAPAQLSEADEGSKQTPRVVVVDGETAASFARTMRSLSNLPTGQGPLLRRGALTTLVSFLEVLISDLIQFFYLKNPAALPAETQTLSLAELRELDSVEDAERYLIYRETDGVLRRSLEDQLAYFSKRLHVDLGPLDADRDALTEVVQRRNLLIHNNGVVNRQYISQVASNLVEQYGAIQGKRLRTTSQYLSDAIDSVYLSGLTLIQQCWRKWDKASTDQADTVVVERLYQSLLDERFQLTTKLAQRLQHIRFNEEKQARMATINHAIALKELGRTDEMESVLASMDWSACAAEYKLALFALRNDDEQFYELLPKIIVSGEIAKSDLKEWPLFAHQRPTERFAQVLSKHFPNDDAEDNVDGTADEENVEDSLDEEEE